MDKKLLRATTRDAIVKAFEREAKKAEFVLSGRGHEPRVTLNRSMAALLKQCNLPRVTISGFGANNVNPASTFTLAKMAFLGKLGWTPFENARDSTVYLVHPPTAASEGAQP